VWDRTNAGSRLGSPNWLGLETLLPLKHALLLDKLTDIARERFVNACFGGSGRREWAGWRILASWETPHLSPGFGTDTAKS